MFGFLASARFDESKIWQYASISVFEETGGGIKIHKGKIFRKSLIEVARELMIGQQVQFEIRDESRGGGSTRRYYQFTDLKPWRFISCPKCGKANHPTGCTGTNCNKKRSEKLFGEFKVIDVAEITGGVKLVLRKEDIQFTFIQWSNGPFKDQSFEVGDIANVIGWRTQNRLTQLRLLNRIRPHEEPLHSPSSA